MLNVMSDLDNKIIKTVGNPRYKLKEDSLRILRAIRFATILDFEIEEKTKHYLSSYSYLLKKLSYQRKKQELDKIFSNVNNQKGISLLIELGIDKSLSLNKLKKINPCHDLIGIWTQLEVDDIYPFTKNEKDQMKKIRKLLSKDIHDRYNIYKYGLYISTVAYQIKNEPISNLNKIYKSLPIHSQKDIKLKPVDISKILNKEPNNYIKEIMTILEKEIINNNLDNNEESLKKYILENYN
jgi:tRNA nucleotidyltransferase (CCA-adding enzyme)